MKIMRALGALAVVLLTLTAAPTTARSAEIRTVGDVFRAVSPSVVVVRAKGRDAGATGIRHFTETGSGVLISNDGKVITAAHVVHAMDSITVEILAGASVPARVVSSVPAADLALLQLDQVPRGAGVATMANSDAVRVGDQVIVVGAPYGLSHSMSAGFVSARWPANTVYRAMPLAEFLQTDASINTGNSGGPMFDMQGRVIGIVSHNISKSGGSEGLGFVVTSNTARELLLEQPSFWSGVDGQVISGPVAQVLNVPQSAGYLVKTVATSSAGDVAGLRGGAVAATILGEQLVIGGDIILKVNDISVGDTDANRRVHELFRRLAPGAPFTMTVLRLGQVMTLEGRKP